MVEKRGRGRKENRRGSAGSIIFFFPKLGAVQLHPSYYWTGTLDPDNRRADGSFYRLHAWALNFNNGMSYSCNIEYYAYIRPLLEF